MLLVVSVVLIRKQVGVRFQLDVWHRFRDIARGENRQGNEVLESCMQAVVQAGSTRVLDLLMVSSDSQRLADEVRLERILQKLNQKVDHAYCEHFLSESKGGPWPPPPEKAQEIQALIDQALALLPRIKDPRLVNEARTAMARGLGYIRDFEEPSDGYPDESDFTKQARKDNKVRTQTN